MRLLVQIEILQSFLINFQVASKFVIVSVKLILPKIGVDRFIGPQHKPDIRYEFGFRLILKSLKCI